MDATLKEWISRVNDAAESGSPLCLRGGGSKDFYGGPRCGEVLDTAAYRGIVSYEPTELVVVARAGTPLAELEAVLREKGQCLPFEPPHFGAASVGGMVAAGLSGPRRAAVGAVRDYVLGVRMIDGKGALLSFGGQVMKNVAGFDVPRLMAGSLGTLGIIAEVSLKVLPLPMAAATLRIAADEASAIRRLNEWGGRPLPIAASVWHDGALTVRLAGAVSAVRAARAALGGAEVGDADAFWQSIREQTHSFFAGDAPLWRLAVAAPTPPLGLAGQTLIEWGGAVRWLRGDIDAADLRKCAAAAGGHASLFRADAAAKAALAADGVFHPLSPAVAGIHRRLKAAFDPAGIFNRGRLYPDL